MSSTTPDSWHLSLGRRVAHMRPEEKIQVSCRRCDRSQTWGHETFRHFRRDCPVMWLEEMLKPSCFDIVSRRFKDGCEREVVFLDVSPEDGGCSDEG